MRPYPVRIQPGQVVELGISGTYVRVSEGLVPLIIETDDYKSRVTLTEGEEVTLAFFDGLRLSHDDAVEQAFLFYVATDGKIGSSQVAGAVSLKNEQGVFSQGRASVAAVAVELLPVNTTRRYLLIQNNDAAYNLRLTLDGSAPTAATGFKLGPGESVELQGFLTSNAINAIMDGASAAADNVEFCEG